MTALLFPILLADIGTADLLSILVGASLLGALVTWLFRIEPAGVRLDPIGHAAFDQVLQHLRRPDHRHVRGLQTRTPLRVP